jgi:ornithine cyclodeaminase/alanine dehydrogenase-like protein (mu-crystallin family)
MNDAAPSAARGMIHLGNDDVTALLSMSDVVAALRVGFEQLAERNAAAVPRLELWSPTNRDDAYYCLGSMAGTTKEYGLSAIRIKSDVIHWPQGRRQEKFAARPGTYCGFILLFSSATGEPVALVNDGVLQSMRVGASGGIAADYLANPDATRVGLIGSGTMARTHLEAIALVRQLERVTVFSPTAANREDFATEMSDRIGVAVVAVESPEEAVEGCPIVVTATNSMQPTLDARWITPGAVVLCVTRREVGADLTERADRTLQLDEFSIGPEAQVPRMEFPQSGAGGFVAGNETERARLPWKHRANTDGYPSLIEILAGTEPGRRSPDETILFINVGAQGVQFAAVAGRLYQIAMNEHAGAPMAQEMFLQDVRD